jgi:hypothetical protein
MNGDFGPSPITVASILASDPTGLGARYRSGNAITVSARTFLAYMNSFPQQSLYLNGIRNA